MTRTLGNETIQDLLHLIPVWMWNVLERGWLVSLCLVAVTMSDVESNPMDFQSSDDEAGSEDQAHDIGHYDFPFRWTRSRRIIMVMEMLQFLTDAERAAMILDPAMAWPNRGRNSTQAYQQLHQKIIDDMERELHDQGIDPDNWTGEMPSLDSVKIAAQHWTRRFLEDGTITNRPPHVKGYKLEANEPHLRAIRDLIMAGYRDSDNNQRLFRNMYHLHRLKGKEFEDHFKATGLKTMRSLWLQLKKLFPNLGKVTLRLKKKRDEVLVQACSHSTFMVQQPYPSIGSAYVDNAPSILFMVHVCEMHACLGVSVFLCTSLSVCSPSLSVSGVLCTTSLPGFMSVSVLLCTSLFVSSPSLSVSVLLCTSASVCTPGLSVSVLLCTSLSACSPGLSVS